MDIYLIESIIYYVVLTGKVKQIKCVSFGTPTEIKFRIIGTGLTDTHNIFKAEMPILLLFYSWSIASQCSIEHTQEKTQFNPRQPQIYCANSPITVRRSQMWARHSIWFSLAPRARLWSFVGFVWSDENSAMCVYICARAAHEYISAKPRVPLPIQQRRARPRASRLGGGTVYDVKNREIRQRESESERKRTGAAGYALLLLLVADDIPAPTQRAWDLAGDARGER